LTQNTESAELVERGPRVGRQIGPPLVFALLIVAAAHGISLSSDFLLDDFLNLKNAFDSGWSWSRLMRGFTIVPTEVHDGIALPAFTGAAVRYFRPLFLASLLADHALWGLRPWGYHLTNVLLHLAVVAALYGVLSELIPGRRAMAWFGALLYGVMPFNTVCVAWLSGRTELLPALAMMAGLWAYLRFARTRAWAYYVVSLVAAAIGLLAKENAIVFALIVFAAWLWVVPRPRPRAWSFIPFALLVGLYLVLRNHALGGFPLPPSSFYYHSPSEPGFVWWAMAKSASVFFCLLSNLGPGYPAEVLLARHPGITVVVFAVTAALALWLLWFARGNQRDEWRGCAFFAIAWIIVGMLPTAPIFVVPLYFYFSMAGVCLLFLVIWQRLTERGRPRWLMRPPRAGRWSRRLVNNVVAKVGEPTEGLRICAIDLPFMGAHMKVALKLRWPGRHFEFHIMSVSPYFGKGPPAISRLEQTDARTLQLTALGWPYWAGADGVLAVGDRGPDKIKAGQVLEARGYRVEIAEVVRAVSFRRTARLAGKSVSPLRRRPIREARAALRRPPHGGSIPCFLPATHFAEIRRLSRAAWG